MSRGALAPAVALSVLLGGAAALADPAPVVHHARTSTKPSRTPPHATSGGAGRANASGAAVAASREAHRPPVTPLVTNHPAAGQPTVGTVTEPSPTEPRR
jgi:hypothetical protein